MASVIKLGEKKSAADLAEKQAYEQDKAIDQAIMDAFVGLNERLTAGRINNLKAILSDIREAQIRAKKKEEQLNFQEIAAQLLQEYDIDISEEILKELLQAPAPEIKVLVENKEVKEDEKLAADNLYKPYLSPKFILGIDKILEDKKRIQVMYNLGLQDDAVSQNFAVNVRKKLGNEKTSVNKYATSGAVLLGGTCLGTGINMIIVAGGLAAAGAFPIGLAVLGGVIILGAGLYYAKKKRDRIAEFLPALYGKAENSRELRINKLDGQERHKRLERLSGKRDKKNKKNKKLAGKELDNYVKKNDPGHSDQIEKLNEELAEIDTILESQLSSAAEFQKLKDKYSSDNKFKKMIAFENINKFKNFNECKMELQKRKQEIIFGKGGKDVEEELAKIKEILVDDNSIATSMPDFKTKHGTTFKDTKSFKKYLIKRAKDLENRRAGSLRKLEESQKIYNDALIKKMAEIHGKLEREVTENAKTYTENASLVENKLIKLRWYKQIVPYFAYWGTCIAINVRSLTVSADELLKVAKAGAAQVQKVQEAEGRDRSSIPQFKEAEDVVKSIENAREQFEERVLKVIERLELPGQDDFRNYLKIEECCPTDTEFSEKVARLVSGDKIKDIMLRIFYTHPSTVLSVLDKEPGKIIKNINTVLEYTEQHLSAFPTELECLNSLQIYFPPDKNNCYDYNKFMLVSNDVLENRNKQEDFFKHILEIKKSIMEVNKTLHAVPQQILSSVKDGVNDKIAALIPAAIKAVTAIETQLEMLDAAEEGNRYRAAYINIFSGFTGTDLDARIKKADISDVMLVLDDAKMEDFKKFVKENFKNVQLEGMLKEFIELFSKDPITPEERLEERFKFFQKLKIIEGKVQEAKKAGKAASEEGKQLANLKDGYNRFVNGKLFTIANLQTLKGAPLDDEYIKNNEHLYHSQRVLIDQKRGVLEEVQKSLVLSIPEIEDTLELAPSQYLRRIAKKRRVNYGIPYNPSMSLSMDYISDLFNSTRLAFGEMRGMLFDLKFPDMTINSIRIKLGKILDVVDNENIPFAFENAIKFLSRIRGFKFPGGFDFEVMFGSLFDTMKKEGEVLNSDNQKKIIYAIKGLRDFLLKIPDPFSGYTFPELIIKFHEISVEIGTLSIRLTKLNPFDVNDALEIKRIILRLKTLKTNFDGFKIKIGDIDLKGLVGGLPGGFPFKNELNAFAVDFDPFFKDFKSITANFGKINVGNFPLDDFLYICNCYNGFGGFGDLMTNFLDWLKKYAELDKAIKEMDKNRKKGDANKYNKYKRDFDDIRLKLEKFGKFKMCLGNVSGFLLGNPAFKLPTFLSGVSGISIEGLNSLASKLNAYGNFSFDDMSFIINFLGDVKGLPEITADLKSLQLSIDGLWGRIRAFKKSNNKQDGEELERLKNDLKIAMRRFAMFKDFNVKIGKFSNLLGEIPEFSGIDLFEIDFDGITAECGKFLDGFETTLKGINLSLDLYGGMVDIKNRLSNIKVDFPKVGISEIQLTWDVSWPSFSSSPREHKNKTKKESKTDSSSKFDFDFGDLNFNLKAIDLDEIIKRLEELRKINKDTRERILAELKSDIANQMRTTIGLKSEDEKEFVDKLKSGSLEVEKDLNITLFSLYTIKATIAIINAIKRGGGQDEDAVATELVGLVGKVPGLQSEINVIVDNLNMLKEFSSKTDEDLSKIESLKKDLALKEQELQDIKSGLFELKRLREAFLKSDEITVDTIKYDEPPVSNMLNAMGINAEDAKRIVNKIVEEAKNLGEDAISAAVKTVELAEITIKLSPFVDTIKKINRKDFTSELKDLLEEANALKTDVDRAEQKHKGIKKFNTRLSKLRSIENRLLELKRLTDKISEIPSVDFTQAPYSAALQPFGLSGTMVTSFVENAKEIASEKIDGALRKLKLAEIPLKIAALNKNIKTLSKDHVKPLLELLKSDRKFEGADLGKIVEGWRNQVRDPLDLFKLINAVKNAERLFNELEQVVQLDGVGHQKAKEALDGCRASLNVLAGQAVDQDINILFSNIHDFCNTSIITQAQAETLALKHMLDTGVAHDQDALPSMDAGEFMKTYNTDISRFLTFHEGLMEKLHEYHKVMRISKKLGNTEKIKDAAVEDIEIFKKHYQNIIGLESKMNNFLEQKTRMTALLDKVLVPEGAVGTGVENVKKLKTFVNGLEMFYDLHNPQVVYQNLESAKSLYQELQAHDAQQDRQHGKQMVFSRGASTVGEENAPKPEPTAAARKKQHKQRRDSSK